MICNYCNEEKPLESFVKDQTRPSGYKNYCKPCYNNLAKAQRNANPEAYKAALLRYKENKGKKRIVGLSYQEKRIVLDAIKSERGCWFCGEQTAVCLDFHHKNMDEKEFTISKRFHRPISVLLAEIDKCEAFCDN